VTTAFGARLAVARAPKVKLAEYPRGGRVATRRCARTRIALNKFAVYTLHDVEIVSAMWPRVSRDECVAREVRWGTMYMSKCASGLCR
jgi:hypothetical protein